MQRALIWLNLYGHQAVRRKLKKGVKTQKMHFCTTDSAKMQNLEKVFIRTNMHTTVLM